MSLNDIVAECVSDLAALPPTHESYGEIDKIIVLPLQGENLLRMLFAANHPSIRSDPHVGLIDIFSVSPVPIAIGRDRAADLNSHHIFPFLQNHTLQLVDGSPAVVPMEQFLRNWDIFTNGIFKDLDWANVVAAGGAVLACLKSTVPQHRTNRDIMDLYQSEIFSGSDIDLFLYGLSHTEVSCVISSLHPALNSCTHFTILRLWKK